MILTALALSVALSGNAEPVTEPVEQPYVLVVWESSGTYPDLWPQKLVTSLPLSEPDLFALDAALPDCGVIQIDLYWNNEVTASLIEGGVLHGAGNPPEALAYVLDGQDPWRVLDLGECVVEPPIDPPVDPPVDPPIIGEPEFPEAAPQLAATGDEQEIPWYAWLATFLVGGGVTALLVAGASRRSKR